MTIHEERENLCWNSSNTVDGAASAMWAIAAGLYAIANANAYAARHLGNGNAMTDMGAIEAFGKHIGDKMDSIADALRDK